MVFSSASERSIIVVRLSCPVHEIPISLWAEFQGILTIRTNRSQVFLYQEHLLGFATAMLQILFTDVDGSGEIYLVGMFCLTPGLYHCMRHDQFAEVVEDKSGIYFL